MNSTAIFAFGIFVTLIAASGLLLTVLEFKRIERDKHPRNPKFPL